MLISMNSISRIQLGLLSQTFSTFYSTSQPFLSYNQETESCRAKRMSQRP